MPDIIGDGRERWDFVAAIANIALVTTTEANGGLRISQWMTKDGATGFSPDTADAPTSSKESNFDTATNGRITFSNPRLRFKKQSGTDSVFTTLTQDTPGFLIRRNSILAPTAYSSGQLIQVFPIICSLWSELDQDDNMPERFDVPVKITLAPNLRAAIA
jgi:hypothetical protein